MLVRGVAAAAAAAAAACGRQRVTAARYIYLATEALSDSFEFIGAI